MLNLEGNLLQVCNEIHFGNLHQLDTLNMRNVGLTTLESDCFRGLRRLTTLHLEENQLDSLTDEQFSETPELQYLFLAQNKLAQLRGEVFINNPQLIFLDMSYTLHQRPNFAVVWNLLSSAIDLC